jgi:hypothetical protein
MTAFRQVLAAFRDEASINDLVQTAEFVGKKQPSTALEWFTEKVELKGETLLRLQHFLHLSGWEVDELNELPAPAFKLGQLITLNLVSVPTVVKRLGYTQPTGLYKVLQGGGILEDRLEAMQKLVDESEALRKQAVEEFPIMRRSTTHEAKVSESVVSKQDSRPAADLPATDMSQDVVTVLLANSIVSTTLLLGEAEKREAGPLLVQVRTMVGTARVSTLIEQLMRLLD